MTKTTLKQIQHRLTAAQRQASVAQALASVSAEGLNPSDATKRRLEAYAKGTISLSELQQKTLRELKTR